VSILLIEDLTMAVYLPILAALVAEGATIVGLLTAGVALLATAALLALALLALALRVDVGVSRALFSRSDETLVLTILGVAILVAGVAELVEISAAVGALLVGIALSGPAAHGARNLLKPLRDVFAAMFFVSIGLRVDPASLPPAIPVALALAAVGAATKFATGWIGAGWRRMAGRERGRLPRDPPERCRPPPRARRVPPRLRRGHGSAPCAVMPWRRPSLRRRQNPLPLRRAPSLRPRPSPPRRSGVSRSVRRSPRARPPSSSAPPCRWSAGIRSARRPD